MTEPAPPAEPFKTLWESLTPFKRELWGRSLAHRLGKTTLPREPVFHYTSPEAFEKILTTGAFRLSNAAYLNDQGELTYPARIANFVLRAVLVAENDDSLSPMIDAAADSLATHALFKRWFVASFTTRGNLLSQWRAYCPHGGYSIGLDGAATRAIIDAAKGYQFGPVVYDIDRQLTTVKAQVMDHVALWRELRPRYPEVSQEEYDHEIAYTLGLALSEEFVFFKDKAFEEEQEWRLVRYGMFPDTPAFYERLGLLTPYLEISLFGADGRLPLVQVFVSPLGEQELSAHSANLILRNKNYPEPSKIIQVPTYRLRF